MTDATKAAVGRSARAQSRQLASLLRHLLKSPCAIAEQGPAAMWLQAEGQGGEEAAGRSFAASLVQLALSRGLAERQGERIFATALARPFLKRALLEAEDAFAGQHRQLAAEMADVEGTRQKVLRNRNESPLAAMARLKEKSGRTFLPEEALLAGERLHGDFTHGQMQPRITASWQPRLAARSKGARGGQADLADSALAARQRFSRAMQAMGPELCGVAVDICCFGKGLETVERERQWPARSAKLMLRVALLSLSRHYNPPAPDARSRAHHWGAEDSRPVMP